MEICAPLCVYIECVFKMFAARDLFFLCSSSSSSSLFSVAFCCLVFAVVLVGYCFLFWYFSNFIPLHAHFVFLNDGAFSHWEWMCLCPIFVTL